LSCGVPVAKVTCVLMVVYAVWSVAVFFMADGDLRVIFIIACVTGFGFGCEAYLLAKEAF
jgi:hypothetical protein